MIGERRDLDTLILVPGLSSRVEVDFGLVLPSLARRYRVEPLASSRAVPSVSLAAAALRAQVLGRTGRGERVGIVALGLGALIAVDAASHPDAGVDALVLLSPCLAPTRRFREVVALIDQLQERPSLQRDVLGLAVLGPEHREGISSRSLPTSEQLLSWFVPLSRSAEAHDSFAHAHRVGVRALVLSGALDQLSPASTGRALAAAIPGSRAVEIAAGHLMTLERPIEITSLIIDHLQHADSLHTERRVHA